MRQGWVLGYLLVIVTIAQEVIIRVQIKAVAADGEEGLPIKND